MVGARHGMCELTARPDRGTALARHAMCEMALTLTDRAIAAPNFYIQKKLFLFYN
jgi:hypothetical protein